MTRAREVGPHDIDHHLDSAAPGRGSAAPARRYGSGTSRLPLLVVAGGLTQVAVRLLLARWQGRPAAYPDEAGYLLAARWLAGGPGGDLSGSTFYQGGYPLLLIPAFWLSHDPATCYRIAIGIGALVGATVFPLGYVALRRMDLARAVAYPLALASSAALPDEHRVGNFVYGRYLACLAVAYTLMVSPPRLVLAQLVCTAEAQPGVEEVRVIRYGRSVGEQANCYLFKDLMAD